MNFSQALTLLREGVKLTRTGWNGVDMFIYMVAGSKFKVNRAPLLGIYPEGYDINYLPHVDMKYADGSCGTWNASDADIFAEDWEVVSDGSE